MFGFTHAVAEFGSEASAGISTSDTVSNISPIFPVYSARSRHNMSWVRTPSQVISNRDQPHGGLLIKSLCMAHLRLAQWHEPQQGGPRRLLHPETVVRIPHPDDGQQSKTGTPRRDCRTPRRFRAGVVPDELSLKLVLTPACGHAPTLAT